MRHIPLLGEQGAEREPDRAKPQKWLRHQENAAKPQKRRRRARSASAIARSRLVVSSADLRRRAELTTPSATDRNGSIVFDVADTPPLRGGECAAPKTLSKKLKVAALLHKREPQKAQKIFFFVPFVVRSPLLCKAILLWHAVARVPNFRVKVLFVHRSENDLQHFAVGRPLWLKAKSFRIGCPRLGVHNGVGKRDG